MGRVAITTARDGAGRLVRMAKRYGLTPVPLPCIEVIPASSEVLDAARALAAEADWMVVTSSRAVTILWPMGGMPEVPVAAVGKSTAVSVEHAGGVLGLVGEAGGRALTVELGERLEGRSVFFPHASEADPSTIAVLEEAGAEVGAVTVYETTPIAPGPDPVDAAVYGSPSAVTGWLLSRSLDDMVLAAIGETTAGALADAGRYPDVVPARPDFEDLMARLAEHMRVRSPA